LITASEIILPTDFYKIGHQKIFDAMLALSDRGEPVDVVTVTEQLSATQELENVGGMSYLAELATAVPTSAHVEQYAKIIEEKSTLRRLIRTAADIIEDGYTREDEVEEVVAQAEARMMEVSNRKNSGDFRSIDDVLVETFANIEVLHQHQGEVTGIPTGFDDLDKITAGFQRNDLIIVAARPSVGKTAFALNIAQNVGTKTDENVAIFSLEMGADQLV